MVLFEYLFFHVVGVNKSPTGKTKPYLLCRNVVLNYRMHIVRNIICSRRLLFTILKITLNPSKVERYNLMEKSFNLSTSFGRKMTFISIYRIFAIKYLIFSSFLKCSFSPQSSVIIRIATNFTFSSTRLASNLPQQACRLTNAVSAVNNDAIDPSTAD